jgi:hypothetical protein
LNVPPLKAPLFLLFFLGAAAHAQDAGTLAPPRQLLVRAQPEKVQLGEPFTLEVVITHEKAQRIDLHPPGDLGDFDLLESGRQRVDGPESSTTTFQLKLSAFTLGKQKTPDFTFDVVQGPLFATVPAAGTEIEVLSTLPADAAKSGAGMFDIRPPEAVPVRTWRLLIALAAVLAGAAVSFALYRYLKRPRAVFVPAKPVEALHVRTLALLDALRAEDLPGKGRAQEFYFRLSESLRRYLGERYAFEALESTSSELLETLRTLHTPGLPMKDVVQFALDSDLAKFAKALPTPDECKASLELAYRVVYATTPSLAPPADANRPAQLQ